jgi:hypothetical protein
MEHFTDEELAFLRHVRFGEVPPRVEPEDYVELQETDPQRAPLPNPTLAQIQYRGQPSV